MHVNACICEIAHLCTHIYDAQEGDGVCRRVFFDIVLYINILMIVHNNDHFHRHTSSAQGGRVALAKIKRSHLQEERAQRENDALLLLQVHHVSQ